MKPVVIFISILVLIFAPGVDAQQVVLDHIDGQISPGILPTGIPVTFHFRFNNTSGQNVVASVNGISIRSTTAATWSVPVGNWNAGIVPAYYNSTAVGYRSADGMGADSILFSGVGPPQPGLPVGYNATVFSITTTFPAGDVGKSIIIDSCWMPPSSYWAWYRPDATGFAPSWGGAYTFTFADISCGDVDHSGSVNILDLTYLIKFLYKGGPAPNCP